MITRRRLRLAGVGAGIAASLVVAASPTEAARTVYFADPGAGTIAQLAVAPGGGLSALDPAGAPAHKARRLAMTPDGESLYATARGAVLQYDVAPDGRLTPKQPAALAVGGEPHSIAVSPDGGSVYVTDRAYGKVRQYAVGAGGRLEPRDPAAVAVGRAPTGIAVSPDGASVYALTKAAVVRFAVAPNGSLAPGDAATATASTFDPGLQDVALTPDGRRLYATAATGAVLAFDVGADGALTGMKNVAVDGCPVGIAVAPDGTRAFVAVNGWPGPRVLAFAIDGEGTLTPDDPPAAAVASWTLSYLAASPDGGSLYAGGGDGFLFDVGPLLPKDPASVDLGFARGVVVSPNQSPVASFSAGPAAVGEPVAFDASAATDPDGAIVRFDWDFGDGTTLADGGPQPQHVYATSGTFTVVLTVVDNEGASTATVFTGGTVLGRGTPGARTERAVEVTAAAAPPPAEALAAPPPPEPAQERPVPDLGETLVAEPVSGTVLIRLPGSSRFQPLRSVSELALGSTIDTRRGRVDVETIRKRHGRVQSGTFYDGVFAVRQRKAEKYVTELVLRGALPRCDAQGAHASAKGGRRLWGDADGRFRTRGRYSSGTVRGTKWLVEDRCDGTLTVVRRGEVAVRDFVRDRTVLVDAGERYLAQP